MGTLCYNNNVSIFLIYTENIPSTTNNILFTTNMIEMQNDMLKWCQPNKMGKWSKNGGRANRKHVPA